MYILKKGDKVHHCVYPTPISSFVVLWNFTEWVKSFVVRFPNLEVGWGLDLEQVDDKTISVHSKLYQHCINCINHMDASRDPMVTNRERSKPLVGLAALCRHRVGPFAPRFFS